MPGVRCDARANTARKKYSNIRQYYCTIELLLYSNSTASVYGADTDIHSSLSQTNALPASYPFCRCTRGHIFTASQGTENAHGP